MKAEDFALDLDRAVSLGLIVNELVSNSLKHAFRDGHGGRIEVKMTKRFDRCTLTVTDDGVGLPQGWQSRGTLGLQLVHDLAEQLRGRVEVTADAGTRVAVTFGLTS